MFSRLLVVLVALLVSVCKSLLAVCTCTITEGVMEVWGRWQTCRAAREDDVPLPGGSPRFPFTNSKKRKTLQTGAINKMSQYFS